eukprot:TRINITY_DN21172_c1_g1_i1.p1 TRINITY_DN21172_c1_g1~~TRINITY_DN21172_c1_g1_i1.p1  ORF type:complete len:822 (+),score=367.38 TRINITY_DN21172_c1_g1_i1:42-2468(+)
MAEVPLTAEEEQAKWLREGLGAVELHAGPMKAAIESRNLQEVLKYASLMLAELRTSNLSPQNYYELYVKVSDELGYLEQYFNDEVLLHGRKVEELYEIVQHAGNIVPRLYLLITVGSVYIKSKEAPAKDILKDLVEMCKGVQHPTRGLFLRHYLSTLVKNKLPDVGNEYEGEESGNVKDSVEFVLQNFKEMVWLWVRMESKQIVTDPLRRAKEREAVKILVGFNLTRLGNLDGIDLEMYKEVVMPRVMEVIANSKDVIAQQYLSEVMIQVFPDEFHLATLEDLLQIISSQLMSEVNLQTVLTSLMDRLGRYSVQTKESGEKRPKWERNALASMFDFFQNVTNDLVEQRPETLDCQKFVSTKLALLKLVLMAYPDRYDRINDMFGATAKHLEGQKLDNKTVSLVKQMLTKPVDHYGSMSAVLDLDGWPVLLEVLDFPPRREVARELCQAALKAGEPITTVEHVTRMFEFIKPLVVDSKDDTPAEDDDEFEDDQILVAKMVHLFENENTDSLFKMLSTTRKQFGQGGEKRIKYTLTPLVFCFLKLASRKRKLMKKAKKNPELDVGKVTIDKILKYVSDTLEVLSRQYAKQALNVYLQAARVADRCDLPEKCSDFLDCAFLLYEEEICSDSKLQISQLPVMVSTVESLTRLDEESSDKYCQKLCSYSSRLLKKPDQCRAAAMCSVLFAKSENPEQGKKVLECLKRSIKTVDSCTDSQSPPLFVDILNRYLYFFANCNKEVTVKQMNVLWEMTNVKFTNAGGEFEDLPDLAKPKTYLENTLEYVKAKRSNTDNLEDAKRWKEIQTDAGASQE